MRDPITSVAAAVALGLLLAGCAAPAPEPGTAVKDAATLAAERQEAARADARRGIEGLEAAIADARLRISTAESSTGLTREQRLVLSETRRAVVVANVSLQKARTALAAADYAASRQAVEGAADRLRAVAEGKSVTSAQPPASSRQ